MPRRIIIHPGFHKTGTTTLQETLKQNRNILKPYVKIVLGGQFSGLRHAARGYSTWRDIDTLAKAEVRFAELLQSQPKMPRRTLLISSEELSGHLPGRPNLPDYSAAETLAKSYVRISRALFPKTDIILFYTLRDAASWLESAYWQHVKSSNMTMDAQTFFEEFSSAANFAPIVRRISQLAESDVMTAPMNAWGEHPLGPLGPLLERCDVPQDIIGSLHPASQRNTRPDQDVLLALLEANRAYTDSEMRRSRKADILAAQKGRAT